MVSTLYGQIGVVHQQMSELEKTVSKKSWEKAYSYRIRKFFEEYLSQEEHKNRSLLAITENEVNNFLQLLPYKHNEKVNYYRALKKFFDYTAKKGLTQPFYIRVDKLVQQRIRTEYISDEHVRKMCKYIDDSKNLLGNRFTLALLLYTGLGRKYLSDLTYEQISDDMKTLRLKGVEHEIPIKKELRNLLAAYKIEYKLKRNERIFDVDETAVTYRAKIVSKVVCGKAYTPTHFSNTFIKKALGEQDQWKNIYTVSQLTNESLATIAKHISVRPSWIFSEQEILLDRWK